MFVGAPTFSRRTDRRHNTCIANLKQFDGAKEQWALEHLQPTNTPVRLSQLVPSYIRTEPVCPMGGNYQANPIGTPPTCSYVNTNFPAHALP